MLEHKIPPRYLRRPCPLGTDHEWLSWDSQRHEQTWQHIAEGWRELAPWLAELRGRGRHCVQAGGWQGLYPRMLTGSFDRVTTWEPHPWNRHCLEVNCQGLAVDIRSEALGEGEGQMILECADTTGQHRLTTPFMDGPQFPIAVTDRLEVTVTRLDTQGLEQVDLIILDLEGWERAALMGARDLIQRDRPCIVVERSYYKEITDRLWMTLKLLDYEQIGRTDMDSFWRPRPLT